MGYIAHDAVIAVVSDYDTETQNEIEAFRAFLGDEFGKYLLGPVVGVNGYTTYVFAPDGSKEGWQYSTDVEARRQAFAEIAGKRFGSVVHVRFGGDYGHEVGTWIVSTTDPKIKES
jgi:hypothetical protein